MLNFLHRKKQDTTPQETMSDMPSDIQAAPEESSAVLQAEPEDQARTTLQEQENGSAGEEPLEFRTTAEADAVPEEEEPEPEPPAGPAGRIFNLLAPAGLPVLILLAAAATGLAAWAGRPFWSAAEMHLAEAAAGVGAGDWLALAAGGAPYAGTAPMHCWFIHLLSMIPGTNPANAPFLASAAAFAAFTASVWALAMAVGAGLRAAFAAGLIALGTLPLVLAAGSVGTEIPAAAVATASMAFLYRGWTRRSAPLLLTAGFLLAGASAMINGPLGIASAIVTSVVFLIWRGTPGRLNGRDGLPGFALMLIMVAAWFATLYLGGHSEYLRTMLGTELAGAVLTPSGAWWLPAATVAAAFLPWTLIPLFANWARFFRGIPSAWKARRESGGAAWLWTWAAVMLALLMLAPSRHAAYAIPLAAPLCVLAGRSLLALSPVRSRCLFIFAALVFAAAGLALVLAEAAPVLASLAPGLMPAIPSGLSEWLPAIKGAMYSGGILVLLAVILLFFTRLALPGGALLVTVLLLTSASLPWQYFTAPAIAAKAGVSAMQAPAPKPSAPAPAPGDSSTPPPAAPASNS